MKNVELLTATVGHERFSPKKNAFTYQVYYTVCPVTNEPVATPALFSFNRFNVLSMHTKDHGPKDGSAWRPWIAAQCSTRGMHVADDDVVLLVAHPRLFGFAFNPISYWLVFEKNTHLKAVLCEVHNTFGDNHNYLLLNEDFRSIEPSDLFAAKKNLYVSPFNTVAPGSYTFSFTVNPTKFKSVINYYENNVHLLNTYMGGTRTTLTTRRICTVVIMYPLMTLLVVWRIHWQAVRLYVKGVRPTLSSRPQHTKDKTTQGSRTTP
ncbi:MAG: DUF1365 domain-containing protein [Candidatus Pacebacteria bacterium]|nr:DUF1365 domain-containing protein [Candidatus Paceibacterota bacterium]